MRLPLAIWLSPRTEPSTRRVGRWRLISPMGRLPAPTRSTGGRSLLWIPRCNMRASQAIFGPDTTFYGWHYPPFFLFVAAGLALLPYGLALAVWQIATFLLYLVSIRAILAATPISSDANGEQCC